MIVDYSSNTYTGNNAGIYSYNYGSTSNSYSYIQAQNSSSDYDTVSYRNIEQINITGTPVDDQITTGDGDDTIDGGMGSDRINGGNGNDVLSGGDDKDNIIAGSGNDSIDGGNGFDTLIVADFATETQDLTIDNTGSRIDLSNGESVVNVEFFKKLVTGSSSDTVDFTTIDTSINTGDGDDSIISGSGNDVVIVEMATTLLKVMQEQIPLMVKMDWILWLLPTLVMKLKT